MCRTFSGVIKQDEEIIMSDYTDTHGYIILANGLKESSLVMQGKNGWARFEYYGRNLCDIKTYKLTIDESTIPDWLTDEVKERLTKRLKEIVKKKILTKGKIPILLGGKWILGGNVIVEKAVGANIILMHGKAKVGVLRENSQVGVLWGNSQVGVLRENSRVGELWGNSRVGELWGNSRVIKDNRIK